MCVNLLENKTFFKLICGAGNEDCESVKKLVYVYAKAGCKVFDLSARKEILQSAKDGVNSAAVNDVHYCISIGIKGDKHISKAGINSFKCITCGNCARVCPNGAIYTPNIIDEKKCLGCGKCAEKCPTGAINMYEKNIDIEKVLPELIDEGAEIIELHIIGHDKKDLDYKWKVINQCNPKLVSICIDRENFGNKEALLRIKEMISSRKPYTTIIQADGVPMSGSEDNYKTTLQAVAMAEIVQNADLPVYITLSGGTNSKTMELCHQCGIYPHGVAIGSWARKIIKEYTDVNDFWENAEVQRKAELIARSLLKSNLCL